MVDLMGAGCRVAFAAFLHDLGKLTERAGIYANHPNLEANQHHYCPFHNGGWFSHKHAACTALAMDDLEHHLPKLLAGDTFPFSPRVPANDKSGERRDATDSLINAAAMHHKPDTFLQWCIATADRVASGFERDTFEKYNASKDREDYIRAELLTSFESLFQKEAKEENDLLYRYQLRHLTAQSLFPVRKTDRTTEAAREEYQKLWEGLLEGLEHIPTSHRESWPLWLDHFDSLWLTYSHAIPSATAFGVKPDVSLYDHSKTTAALAVALWRYHHDLGHDPKAVAARQRTRDDWDEDKFLLVQGDFFGIQDFIFGGRAETAKQAAKLLRGRSFFVSLMMECAALRVLDALDLPATSQVINAAGKFLIVAPNTQEIRETIKSLQQEFNKWFLDATLGVAGLGLAMTAVSANVFVKKDQFKTLLGSLWESLDRAKFQRQGLCGQVPPSPILNVDYSNNVCAFDSRLPANATSQDGKSANTLSLDQIKAGELLAKREGGNRILIFRDPGDDLGVSRGRLKTTFFGYTIVLTTAKDASGNFGAFARNGSLRRAFDIALPQAANIPVWSGYSRRLINAYVPVMKRRSDSDPRYDGLDFLEAGEIKTFEHLARDSQKIDSNGKVIGTSALGVLKGDVDNLGLIFQSALKEPTFAKWAELSRRVNAFFSLWLPSLCHVEEKFQDIYTIFAGGDDFFIIGPWNAVQSLAGHMRKEFGRYCANNAEIHFSAGYVMVKPGHPLRLMTERVEDALASAKQAKPGAQNVQENAKNAFSLHGQVVPWAEWKNVVAAEERLEKLSEKYQLSTGFRYGLLQLAEMAERVDRQPENARWRSLMHYRTRRYVTDKMKDKSLENREAIHTEIVTKIGEEGIGDLKGHFRITLYNHLYRHRD